MRQEWDADPEDIETIREGLVDGLIERSELPTERTPDFTPLVSERALFGMLAERVRELRKLSPSDLERYLRQRDSAKEERNRAPYALAIALLLMIVVVGVLVCYASDDRCVQEVRTAEGTECVEYESDSR